MKTLAQIHQLINASISETRYGENPKNLYEPIEYIMSLGGKRLRPSLVLLSFQLFGKDPVEMVRPALAVEVFHNFTLLHDDIMDEAPLRRGMPTVHEKWDQTVAILSGDAMLIKAYDLLLQAPREILPEMISRFNKTAVEVCEGQQIDMNFETQDEVAAEDYLEMIRLKTAVLLGFSMEMGARLALRSEEESRELYAIGEYLGLGFQLMDDYLDVYADKNKFGKQVGGDIIANKKTYLLIQALQHASASQRNELLEWLALEQFDQYEKVQSVTRLYNAIGIPEMTHAKMNQYFDLALKSLQCLETDKAAQQELTFFVDRLINRER